MYAKPPADGALPDPSGTFTVVHTPFDPGAVKLKSGEVLVENQYLSIDPYHRFGLYDPAVTRSQFLATRPGDIISTYGVSRVVRSANPRYAVGDLLYSWVRWERFTVVEEPNLQYLQKVKAGVDPVHYLGPLGTPGLTGYAGITQIAKPTTGETIVVSATTGAVGMVASQLAKLRGLTVVGMAGSDEKVRYLVDELGLDSAFNYRTAPSLEDALKQHCPRGIDIFFDLVGGQILDAALPRMNLGGRIPSAGMVSQYNLPHDKRYGLKNLHSIVGMDITIESYRSSSWEHLIAEMRDELKGPLSDGTMKFKTHVAEGLENLPAAFYGMFTGESFGKTVVKV
nr:NADP-dependent oxidoreductase [Streptomyces sp. NBC_00886]